jgi:hypothetical protein
MSDDQQIENSIRLLDIFPDRDSVLLGQPEEGFFFEMSNGKIVRYVSEEEYEQLRNEEHGRIEVDGIAAFIEHHLVSAEEEG